MSTVELTLDHAGYAIRIEAGLLASLGPAVRAVVPHDRAALIVDERIATTHGQVARASLEAAGYAVTLATMQASESQKSLDTVRALYERLLSDKLERRSPVVALGGGITGDVAGFVAATYLRGVPLIQCPTTLLAMVDASVGGKVGVNVPQGKNLIGAFYQPRLVAIDPQVLATLPARELRCGLAECIKHAVIRDRALFDWIASHLDAIRALDEQVLGELIERNVRIKAAVVSEDEKEAGVRAHLNFGHTFGHAIEAACEYGSYLHGEAVALGMVAATHLAVERGLCEAGLLERLRGLIDAAGLPTSAKDLPATERLIEVMTLDKKVADGRIRLVLPTGWGEVDVFDDTDRSAIADAWQAIRADV